MNWIAVLTGQARGLPNYMDSTTFYIAPVFQSAKPPVDPCEKEFD